MLNNVPTFEIDPETIKSAPSASPIFTASSDETIPVF